MKIPFIFTGWGIIIMIIFVLAKATPSFVKSLPDFYKTLPLKIPRGMDNENSGSNQDKITLEIYWTFNNQFQDIRKTKSYKALKNKKEKIEKLNLELLWVKKQMKKDVDKAKEEDYQILNSEMQNVIANLKYFRDLGEEIEKLE
mgnify:CR=1 FL=1